MICDIEEREKPYHPSQLTRFRTRVGPERLERIIAGLVEALIQGGLIRGARAPQMSVAFLWLIGIPLFLVFSVIFYPIRIATHEHPPSLSSEL